MGISRQARGDDGHNLVTIVMHALNLDLHAALEWISDLHDKLAKNFLAAYDQVPDYSDFELNRQVVEYLDGLGNWVSRLSPVIIECIQYPLNRSARMTVGHSRYGSQ
jgi:hypothetical protein